jgi:hypothetical protein
MAFFFYWICCGWSLKFLLGKTVFPRWSMCMQLSGLISSSLPSRNLPWRVPLESQMRKTESEFR